MASLTGKCCACDYAPLGFNVRSCPRCATCDPNPSVVSRFIGRGAVIGMFGGAFLGVVWGLCVVGGVGGAFGGAIVLALPGLLVGFIGGMIVGLIANLLGSEPAEGPTISAEDSDAGCSVEQVNSSTSFKDARTPWRSSSIQR
jgi:hypothetical protein